MSGAVDESELHLCVVGVAGRSQMRRQWHTERRETEVQRDTALSALRVLVETRRAGYSTQRFREARFPAVNVTQHANVKVQDDVLCLRHNERN